MFQRKKTQKVWFSVTVFLGFAIFHFIYMFHQHRTSDSDKGISVQIFNGCMTTSVDVQREPPPPPLPEDMTIITAYFDIGSFQKGDRPRSRTHITPETYYSWSKPLRYLTNPMIIYTDSKKMADLMMSRRVKNYLQNKTKIVLVDRDSLWPFKLIKDIKRVFATPRYPKYYPNTVLPEYPCVQHAKYAVVADAIKRKFFKTDYYAWVDIGYFRLLENRTRYFTLNAPEDMDNDKIAFTRVGDFKPWYEYKTIFHSQKLWVGGGMFIGTAFTLLKFEISYKNAVDFFLYKKKLMNSDQQILYAMYTHQGHKDLNPDIELQTFSAKEYWKPSRWFHLGFKCMKGH